VRQPSKLKAVGVVIPEEPEVHNHDFEFVTKAYTAHLRSREREEKAMTFGR
jgi:hypothetical protein